MRWKSFALIIACTMLMIGSAFAQGVVVPGDNNDDKIVSVEEVAAAEKLAQEGKLSAENLQEIKHIHEKYPITITDSANRTVIIYKPVKTIVPLSWTDYEPLFVLGAADKIAGVRTDLQKAYSWIPGMSEKTAIGTDKEIDYEKIVELKPDLVVSSTSKLDSLEGTLAPAGIPYVIVFRTLNLTQAKFDSDLKILSNILEQEERADEYLSWKQNYLDQLKERTDKIKPEDRIKVYCESRHHDFYTATNTSGVNELINIAGGNNIAGDISGQTYYVDVQPEWVLDKNPDVMVVAVSMPTEPPGSYLDYTIEENATKNLDDYLKMTYNRTIIKDTNVAKEGKIYLLHADYTDFGRGFIGVYYMAKWFYPDMFKDLNPDEINKEYFEKWLGVPYNGIWAYPKTI